MHGHARPPLLLACALAVLGCDSLSDDGPDLRSCEQHSDCMMVSADCCGRCGQPSADQVTAIRIDAFDAHHRMVCSADEGCPTIQCVPQPPAFVATCSAGRCEAVELRGSEATACMADADCRIRSVACCECGARPGVGGLVSVSDSAAYMALHCDPDLACDACVPEYPPEVTAHCNDGSCTVEDPRNPFE